MKHMKHFFLFLILALTLCLSTSAQAAITVKTIKSNPALKDVRKAEEVFGDWEITANGTRFLKEDGKHVKSSWISHEGKYYYLNGKGYVITGWISYNDNIYYLKDDGSMKTGWKGLTYYFKKSGIRASGPVIIDEDTYFFDTKTGMRKTGWITYQKKQYYFSKTTGKKVVSKWIQTNSKWRYVNDKGVLQKSCWLKIGDKKYYVNSSGYRVTGEQYIDGKWYYFKSTGVYDPTHKITSNVDPNKKMVALTFDDGPGPYTSSLLSCLRANNARATFFMVGSSVGSYKSVVKQMALQHCELGNHSWSHPALDTLSTDGIINEITKTNNAIKSASGQTPTVVRLPYGSGHNNSRVLSAIGKPSIYWSIDTRDWEHTGSPQSTVNAVLNYVRNGDIVLMHDIHSASVTAAKTIIPALKSRGYQMVTITELAKYKGKQALKSGRTYYNFY